MAGDKRGRKGMSVVKPISLFEEYDIRGVRNTWPSFNKRVEIDGHKVYLIVVHDDENRLVNVFISSNKWGSVISGAPKTIARLTQNAIEHGTPMAKVVESLHAEHYEPYGHTNDPQIPTVKSISDYIGQLIGARFERTAYEKVEHTSTLRVVK